MNAYEKSKSLGMTGTDAAQVAILQTLGERDILSSDLASWLARRGLLDYDGQEWFGLLQKQIDSGAIKDELSDLIRQLKSIMLGIGGKSLRVTVPEFAALVFQVLSGIAAVVPEASAVAATFYDDLAGGRPYKDLTTDEFKSLRESAVPSVPDDLSGYDVLLSVNRTSGITRCSLMVMLDGATIRQQSLTEGQGSTLDQALSVAIESAIDTYLRGA